MYKLFCDYFIQLSVESRLKLLSDLLNPTYTQAAASAILKLL